MAALWPEALRGLSLEVDIDIATEKDRDDFLELWSEFLIVHEKLGSDIRASKRTLGVFGVLFDAYTEGVLVGVPLIARIDGKPVAALLWGETPEPDLDRVEDSEVFGWGSYTVPEHRRQGISRSLRERAIIELHQRGVRVATGTAILSNIAGVESSRSIGFKPTVILGKIDIAEEARKIRVRQAFGDTEEGLTDGFYWEGLCPLCGKE